MHHAILIEGSGDAARARAHAILAHALDMPVDHNPDVHHIVGDRFDMDDARSLKDSASRTPHGSAQAYIIMCNRMGTEAQNALLKLLEEPSSHTYFLLCVPTRTRLLPTIRSRLSFGGSVRSNTVHQTDVGPFVSGTPAERLAIVAPIIKDKDRERAQAFLDALEVYLHEHSVERHAKQLQEVAFVRTYLADTSASLKMLLEHLALAMHP